MEDRNGGGGPPYLGNGEARPPRKVKKSMTKEWRTPPGLPRVPSLETEHSETTKTQFSDVPKWTLLGEMLSQSEQRPDWIRH